jgi:hypothetical protein
MNSGASGVGEHGPLKTRYTVEHPLEGDTLFYWRVRALSDCGDGQWTSRRCFYNAAVTARKRPSDRRSRQCSGSSGLQPCITMEYFTYGVYSNFTGVPALRSTVSLTGPVLRPGLITMVTVRGGRARAAERDGADTYRRASPAGVSPKDLLRSGGGGCGYLLSSPASPVDVVH